MVAMRRRPARYVYLCYLQIGLIGLFSESRMVKTLWILSSRCRPRVGVEMSTLQVGDSGLGEGDEGGAGPGLLLGVGGLQCRPRVDEGEASLLKIGADRLLSSD